MYFISLENIIRICGNKDDQHLFLQLSESFGCIHSSHSRHFDVQKENVRFFFINMLQKSIS